VARLRGQSIGLLLPQKEPRRTLGSPGCGVQK